MEYWNIGGLGFERVNPSFHSSTIPIFGTLDAQGNRHVIFFSSLLGFGPNHQHRIAYVADHSLGHTT